MNELTKLLSRLTFTQKISIVVVVLVAGGAIFSFVHWKHEDDFRPLYTSMAPEDASTVVQKLKESGVEYRLGDNGSTVLVPSAKLAESRLALAAAGLPKSGRIGYELFDKSNFGATEFVEHINYQRALEGELERSVMSLAEVEQARVHLTLPKESVFLDQQQPAKASVMVKLRPGAQISPQNVAAVTHLVASAVQGLAPEAVSVLDMDGNLLSRPRRAATADGSEITSETLEVRQQIEHGLVAKISETVEPLLGPNGFRAGASVDLDLTSGEQQEETLDPTRSVMLSSQKTEESTERAASSGIPGTASNLPNPGSTPNRTSGGVSHRTENITYQSSRVIRHTRIPQGIIKRMSLAVLVDQTVRWEGEGAARKRVLVPPTPETLKTIKDLVAAVTGFNTDRGDQLIVETLPFESSLNAAPPGSSAPAPITAPAVKLTPWQQFLKKYQGLLLPASIGVVVLLGLVIGILKRGRKRRPAPEVEMPAQLQGPASAEPPAAALAGGESPASQLDAAEVQRLEAVQAEAHGREKMADRVRQLAKRDPAATANVLRAWMQDGHT
ncbi:MAG TPA: flagellar basal-body MS-ring/collar protein FliF [Bryobacteraceae bacterium]|nr:flagellar basal-body MS-ring/collar protein FliF [Bryobacteraceae bacterium]